MPPPGLETPMTIAAAVVPAVAAVIYWGWKLNATLVELVTRWDQHAEDHDRIAKETDRTRDALVDHDRRITRLETHHDIDPHAD